MAEQDYNLESQKKFQWDLRARREKFIGDLIELATFHMNNCDYYKSTIILKNLFYFSAHMYMTKNDNEDPIKKVFNTKLSSIYALAEKYENTWNKKLIDKNEDGEIQDAIGDLIFFLTQQIEESGGFGTISKEDDADDYS